MTKRSFIARIVLKAAQYAFFAAAMFALTSVQASAQQYSASPTDATTPPGVAPGATAGSYALSGFESVNPYSGNLDFRLPLLKIGGRGAAQMTMALALNTKQWKVNRVVSGNPNAGDPLYSAEATYWSDLKPGYGPGVIVGRQSGSGTSNCEGTARFKYTTTRLTFISSDGTEYEFIDKLTSGKPQLVTSCDNGPARGNIFVSSDGSAATFQVDSSHPVSDEPRVPFATRTLRVWGELFLKDGTLYHIEDGLVIWIRDRNGNMLRFFYNASDQVERIIDSLKREVTVVYAIADPQYGLCDKISFKGFGAAQRAIHINRYKNLGNNNGTLRSGNIQTYSQLFPELNSASTTEFHTPNVVTDVWLPDGRRYKFQYNSYGELARVELPTGGAIEYDMEAGSGAVQEADYEIYRRVKERRVYVDSFSSVPESRTVYTLVNQSGAAAPRPWTTTVKVEHFGSFQILGQETHYFHGSWLASRAELSANLFSAWNEGREYKTEVGPIVLRKSENTWQQREPVSWWSWWVTETNADPTSEPANDPRITQTVTTMVDSGQTLRRTYGYSPDEFNNVTETIDYGYSGEVLRRAQTDYLTVNPVNGVDYTRNNIFLRGLPTRQSIYDASGAEAARVTYEYDNYSASANHAPLVSRAAISELDASFTASKTTRGNATAASRWLLPGTPLTSYPQYDIAGNTVKIIDPRGNSTRLDFSDRFGSPDGEAVGNSPPSELSGSITYAFVTSATNALSHTAYAQFDYYTGSSVDAQDPNGVKSSVHYNDILDRPTQSISGVGTSVAAQTSFIYNDSNRTITTTGDLNGYGDNLLKSEIIYDGLGRTVESRRYENASNFVSTLQNYDALGRLKQASNPHRPGQDPVEWTTTEYDLIGRVISITTPDNAHITTSFQGNQTTVTDQSLKTRRSLTDALGRLTTVIEDPNGLNYQTVYQYDALDNLRSVSQGSQTRTFDYDSLSRLIQAFNPESGTVSYPLYDSNGNLTSKIDARSIVATYQYDALNRLTQRSYSDSTPSVAYTYDSATIAFSKGRLCSVISTASSQYFDEHDPLGRVKRSRQLTDSQTYSFSYGYDLAGNLTTETYPSGRIITTSYDAAGRIVSLNGQNPGEGLKNYVSSISYEAHGAMKSMALGNGLWEHASFNSRLQPTEIGLGTSAADSSRLRIGYGYGLTDNNGNVTSQSVSFDATAINQSYTYDPLNRLKSASETGGWSQTFDYDRYGNRAVQAGSHIPNPMFTPQSLSDFSASNNRIIAAGYEYDAAGNMTRDKAGRIFGYDAENHQVNFNDLAVYSYDGDGKRVKKTESANTTVFVYDAFGQLTAEYESTGEPGEGTQYLTSDHLGSVRVVTDASGAVKKRMDYLPFGEELAAGIGVRTAAMGYGASEDLRQKFTGYERDGESGLDFAQARYFSNVQGRFTSADDFLNDTRTIDPASWNLYTYVRNNPLRYIDPTGEKIYVGDINDMDKEELLKRINFTYGCESCVTAGKDGYLAINTQGLSNDILNATQYLTDAINTTSWYAQVLVSNDDSNVAFGEARPRRGAAPFENDSSKKRNADLIVLDFEDDKHVIGDNVVKQTFLNTVFAHEVAHRYPTALSDPKSGSGTGPVVDAVNAITDVLGLPRRTAYTSGKFADKTSLPFQMGEKNKKGELKMKNKQILWDKRNVGGKGVN